MAPAPDLDGLSNADLKRLVLELLGRMADFERMVAAQREEIARLKGLKARPTIKPSGMDTRTHPSRSGSKPGRRKPKASQLIIHEERIIPATVPAGSRFKGYEDVLIQDLIVRPHGVRIRRERWVTPDGRTIVAPLPAGIVGHFGPDLHRYVLALYHEGQLTIPRLVAHLTLLGVLISKRQVMRLLGDASGLFRQEAAAVLRAGLMTADWISVDDTGARHQGRTGSCTQIGNDHFTWFGTTASKNRLNFLELLRAGHTDYVINAEALAYMRRRALPEPLIARLAQASDKNFSDAAAWQRHLDEVAMPSRPDTLDPVRLATEGAVWGSIKAHGFLPNTVIVSDDAGQFEVGQHALCWVHAERLIHRLDTFTDHQRAAQQRLRMLVWWFYRDLKLYRQEPSGRRRTELRRRFERIFAHRTGFATLDRLLGRLRANKAELLRVLDRPEIPLHTNSSENDLRAQVIRRKISAGTRSDTGRDCRDAFLGLSKTCRKLGLSFWDYLGARLKVGNASDIPRLADLVSARCSPA